MTDTPDEKQGSLKKETPLLAKMKACGAFLAKGAVHIGQHYLLPALRAMKPFAPTLASLVIVGSLASLGPVYAMVAAAPAMYFTLKQINADLPKLTGNLVLGVNMVVLLGSLLGGAGMCRYIYDRDEAREARLFEDSAHRLIAKGKAEQSYTITYTGLTYTSWSPVKETFDFDAKILRVEEKEVLGPNGSLCDIVVSIKKTNEEPKTRRVGSLILTPKSAAQPL